MKGTAIKRINGACEVESPDETLLVADSENTFRVTEWNSPDVNWTLRNHEKDIVATVTKGKDEQIAISINKKTSGDYRYYLCAGTLSEEAVCIGGYCKPKITKASWKSTGGGGALIPGEDMEITLETEGLNGNFLELEIYDEQKNELIKILEECIEGDIKSEISAFETKGWGFQVFSIRSGNPKDEVELTVKAKNKTTGKYVKDSGGSEDILKLKIKNEKMPVVYPQRNQMLLKVKDNPVNPDEIDPLDAGIIKVTKIEVDTLYEICGDKVEDFEDYEYFWILEDKGKYYHWLSEPKNSMDRNKPKPTPVTLHSNQEFKFTATFEVLYPVDIGSLTIRVNRKDKDEGKEDRYHFEAQTEASGWKNMGDEFEITFSSNLPYKDTVRYFETYDLFFEYSFSFDNVFWIPMRTVKFRLYITWKKPSWESFETQGGSESKTMQVESKYTNQGKKSCILETLLWLACQPNVKDLGKVHGGQADNEEHILDEIFRDFDDLKIIRAREDDFKADGMGYWRGISKASLQQGVPIKYILREHLFRQGEARCPQWSQLLRHVALCHQIELKIVSIRAVETTSSPNEDNDTQFCRTVFLVKSTMGWSFDTDNPEKAPVELDANGNKAQGNPAPLHFFWDHVFTAYKKEGQLKYYDPSYGSKSEKLASGWDELLNIYTNEALCGVVYAKRSQVGSYFEDKKHTGENINLFERYRFNPATAEKYEYKYLTGDDMKDGLSLWVDKNEEVGKKIEKMK